MLNQPCYEVIKKTDIEGAFKDALEHALAEVLERINNLVETYSATAASSLWTWDYTSRWDYDVWW